MESVKNNLTLKNNLYDAPLNDKNGKSHTTQNATRLKKNESKLKWKRIKLQACSITIIASSMLHAGITLAFPNLLKRDFDSNTVTLFASIAALTTPFGTVLTSLFLDRMGRKRTLILIKILCICTWTCVSLMKETFTVRLCSILCGITRGALTSICPTYLSEITHSKYRQLSLSILTLFFMIGVFLTTVLNTIFTWKEAAICFAIIFGALLVLMIFFVPESPIWYAVIKLNPERAKKMLKKYNPEEKMFNKEWNLIEQKLKNTRPSGSFSSKLAMLCSRKVYKPCLILIGLILFQQLCGIYPISSFTLIIIPKICGDLGQKQADNIFLLTGILRLFVSIVTSLFLTKFNQLQLLLISLIGMVLTSFPIFGISYFTNMNANKIPAVDWIQTIFFISYMITCSIGILGIPWTIIFELLPTEVRALLGPLLVAFGYAVMAGVLRIFDMVLKCVDIAHLFSFFGFIALSGFAFVKYFVPETRGKSLHQIEGYFEKKKADNPEDVRLTMLNNGEVLLNKEKFVV